MPKIYTPDLMEEMYGVMEKKNSRYDGFSRGDLITINGKTIREKMLDEYFVRKGEQDDFDYYYQKNVAQKTQEYVEEALQKNQYVEMFEFGEDGLLSEDPIPLVDKENAKIQIDEQYRQKIMESRQQIKLHHFSGQWSRTINEMDGDLSNNHLSENKRRALQKNKFVNPCGFSLERQALSTLVRLRLGAQGHRLEDIVNPDKLQEEKTRAREEVLEHLRPKADLELLAKEIAGIIKEKELGELTEEEIRSLVPKTEVTLTKEEIEEEQQKRGELLDEHDLKAMSYNKTAEQMGEKATKLLQKKLPEGTDPKSVKLDWGMISGAVRRMSWQVHKEDAQWLTEQLLWGSTQLLDQIDTRLRNVDWSNDLKLMDPRLADVYAVCYSMFDYTQEIERVYKAAPDLVLKSAEKICKEHPELGSAQQLYDDTMVRGSIVGHISNYMKDYAKVVGRLSTGHRGCNISRMMEADTFRRVLIAANGPQSGVSKVLDEQTSKKVMVEAHNFFREELGDYAIMDDPDALRLMVRECFSGKLQKNHQFSYDDKTKKFSITGKVTPEMEFAKELEDNSQFVGQGYWLRSKWNSLTEENTEERYGIYREHFTEIVTGMLEDIKNVDPALMRSSQQFRDMKRDLKQLKILLQEGTQNDPAVEMRKACKQLLESTQAYLEYKEADNIGKDRSKQEFKRILTAQRVLKMSKMMDNLSRELPTQPEIEQWRNRRPKNEKEQATQKTDIVDKKSDVVFEEQLDSVMNENERQVLTDSAAEFTDTFLAEVQNSIKELKNADKGMFTGSSHYEYMQNKLSKMAEKIEDMGDGITWDSVEELSGAFNELKVRTEGYLQYKSDPKNCSGSDREKQRIAAAKKLKKLCEKMQPRTEEMQKAMERPEKERVKLRVAEVVNEKYSSQESPKEMQQLCNNIRNNDVYARYIDNPKDKAVKDTVIRHMAEMVAVEHLGILKKRRQLEERTKNNPLLGGMVPKTTADKEKIIAEVGVDTYVDTIMKQKDFKEAVENLEPHKMCSFIYGNTANDLAVKFDKQILKIAQEKKQQNSIADKEVVNQKQAEAEVSGPIA